MNKVFRVLSFSLFMGLFAVAMSSCQGGNDIPDDQLSPAAIQGTYATRAADNGTAPSEAVHLLTNLGVKLESDGRVYVLGQSNTAITVLGNLLGANYQNGCTWSVNGDQLSFNLAGKKFLDFQIVANDAEKLQLRFRGGGSFFGTFFKSLGIDLSSNKSFDLTLRKNNCTCELKDLCGNFTYGKQNRWGADITNHLFKLMFQNGVNLQQNGQLVFAGLQDGNLELSIIKGLCGGKFDTTWKVESGLLHFMVNGKKFMDFNIIDNNEDCLKLSFNSGNSFYAGLFKALGIDFQSSNSFNLTLNR